MAYSRYGKECEYYIFWYEETNEKANEKEDERIAIWHVDYRTEGPTYSYKEIRKILENGDFSGVPGYKSSHKELLLPLLKEFVSDVDNEYS